MIFQTASKKVRTLLAVGMASLATSLLLLSCLHPATATGKKWIDGIGGLFMGLSIGLNLGSFLLIRRLGACGVLSWTARA
jgi:hypothetical protein